MPPVTFTDTQAWYAGLATMYGAAAALITDLSGGVLLVKPNYRDHWSLPGGMIEHGEPPHRGCAREVAEEVGLKITVDRLLVVDWAAPDQERPRPVVFFVFDGGEVGPDAGIRLQEEELDDYRFVAADEFSRYVPRFLEARYSAALRARATGATVYLPPHKGG
jgi:8-oxo-dGTP pyrophosphatase MutT (NUDIX family)